MGVRLVAVGLSSVAENQSWANVHGFSFEVWSDPAGELMDGLEVRAHQDDAPRRDAFVLAPSGQAVVQHIGAVSMGAIPEDVLHDCRVLFDD